MAGDDVTQTDGDVSGAGDDGIDDEDASLRGSAPKDESASYPPVDEQYESADSTHEQTFSSDQRTHSTHDEVRSLLHCNNNNDNNNLICIAPECQRLQWRWRT